MNIEKSCNSNHHPSLLYVLPRRLTNALDACMLASADMQSLADALGLARIAEDDPVKTDDSIFSIDGENLTIEQLSQGVIRSLEWRQSLRQRILSGSLPAAVECKLIEYAFGKPQSVEHTWRKGDPIDVITRVEHVIVDTSRDDDEHCEVTH